VYEPVSRLREDYGICQETVYNVLARQGVPLGARGSRHRKYAEQKRAALRAATPLDVHDALTERILELEAENDRLKRVLNRGWARNRALVKLMKEQGLGDLLTAKEKYESAVE